MLHIDRSIIPDLRKPEQIIIPEAVVHTLDNGLNIYVINSGIDEVLRLDMIFPSGAVTTGEYIRSMATHQLIDSGTSRKSAIEIAEGLDFYGAYLQTEFGADWKSISLYSLTRLFKETLPLLFEIINDPVFPEDELSTWKKRSVQSLRVNKEKVSWLAKTTFQEKLFGPQTIYGYTPTENDYENLQSNDLAKVFNSGAYHLKNAFLILSGKISAETLTVLKSNLEQNMSPGSFSPGEIIPASFTPQPGRTHIEKKDAVQNGIRIGKVLFNKNHPDYQPFTVLNTILGGYFGSRLMVNIREDKGYTYGIGSGILPYKNTGFFTISTETGKEVTEAAIEEIRIELRKLITEPVPEHELELVKNYLIGAFQRSLDGPFALADRLKGLILYGLNYNSLHKYLELLKTIKSTEIQALAQKYLDPDSMIEVVAG